MFYLRHVFQRPCPPRSLRRLGLAVLLTAGLGLGSQTWAQQPAPSVTPPPSPANPTTSGGRIVRPTLRLGSQGESVRELQSMLMLLGYYPGPVSGVYQEDTQLAVQRFQQAAAITADGIVGPATWSKLLPAPAAETTPPGQTVATTAPATNPPTANPTPANPPTTNPSATRPPATNPPATNPPATNPPATNPPATNSRPTTPPATTTPPASTTANLPVLRPGMEGEAVRFLQQRLTAKRVYSGPISGVFGPQTEAAVRQLQRTNNLTVDGIVGPATWNALN